MALFCCLAKYIHGITNIPVSSKIGNVSAEYIIYFECHLLYWSNKIAIMDDESLSPFSIFHEIIRFVSVFLKTILFKSSWPPLQTYFVTLFSPSNGTFPLFSLIHRRTNIHVSSKTGKRICRVHRLLWRPSSSKIIQTHFRVYMNEAEMTILLLIFFTFCKFYFHCFCDILNP